MINELRHDWIDYGKGIGILLVVYGHLFSSGYHAGLEIPEHFFRLSDSILYSFHMPFFFLLSGLFAESSLHKRGVRGYIGDKLLRIAYPYLIWSVLQMVAEIVFSTQTQHKVGLWDFFTLPYVPKEQFWFLYALLVMHIIHAICSLSGRFSKYLLLMISLGLFFEHIPLKIFALEGLSDHFLFFVGGIFLKETLATLRLKEISLWVVGALFVLLIGSGKFIFGKMIEPVRLAYTGHMIYFLYLSSLGILTSVLFAQYLANRKKLAFLKILGTYSLQIFLAHMLAGVATRILLYQGLGIHNWIIHIVLGVIVATAGPILLYETSKLIGISWLFAAPTKHKDIHKSSDQAVI